MFHVRIGSPRAAIEALSAIGGWAGGWTRGRTGSVHARHWGRTAGGLATKVGRNIGTTAGSVSRVIQRETVHVKRVSHVGEIDVGIWSEKNLSADNQ